MCRSLQFICVSLALAYSLNYFFFYFVLCVHFSVFFSVLWHFEYTFFSASICEYVFVCASFFFTAAILYFHFILLSYSSLFVRYWTLHLFHCVLSKQLPHNKCIRFVFLLNERTYGEHLHPNI